MTVIPATWRFADLPRDVVLVEGDEARWFLHSQLSQDVQALPPGRSVWSFILSPDGKVDALVRVVCRSDQLFSLDVERGFGEAVVARLTRFVLRANVRLTMSDWSVRRFEAETPGELAGAAGRAECDWGSSLLVDIVGPTAEMPTGGTAVPHQMFDAVRADRAWPAMGVDLRPGDVPAGTGIIEQAVSFTKGCYPGQELVERMDSRGANAPVQLRSVPLGTAGDGVEITSSGTHRAIARVRRGVDVGETLAQPQ
jgi:folate-binding protein YgfZ